MESKIRHLQLVSQVKKVINTDQGFNVVMRAGVTYGYISMADIRKIEKLTDHTLEGMNILYSEEVTLVFHYN